MCSRQTTLPIIAANPKPHRKDLKSDMVLCRYCPAKCCRYFALSVDTPKTWEDFDHLRWLLLHEHTALFVEEGDWYIAVYNVCKHLRTDNSCAIYSTRPKVCRDYSTKECEYEDGWVHYQFWETPEQVEEYAEAVLGPRRGQGFRSPKLQWGNGQ